MTQNTAAPLAYTVADAVKVSGLARSRLYEELRAGRIEGRKAGRRTLILASSLATFLLSLPSIAGQRSGASGKGGVR